MKKVLMVAGALRTGGAEKVARDLGLYGQARYEFDYLVFEARRGNYEKDLEEAGCRIFRLPKPGKNPLAHVVGLLRLMGREGYQIVHAHTMFHCGWVMLAAKFAGIPVRVAHAHSELKEGGLLRKIYETMMGLLIRLFATDRIACSEAAGERLFGKADFRVIPNGICREDYAFDPDARQTIRRQLGWENCRILGHAGRLNRVKNQKFLLILLSRLLETDGSFRLILAGQGEDREALEQEIARRNLSSYVAMPGDIRDMGSWYSAMDVFVLPSLYEGMPLAILEARYNGLPCVISDTVSMHGRGITPLALENPDAWIRALTQNSERSSETVPDLREMTENIYTIYERKAP